MAQQTPILIFGSTPPPFGGVSVFVQRRKAELIDDGRTVSVLDWKSAGPGSRLRWILRLLFSPSALEVEIHGFQTTPKLLVMLRPFRTRSTLWIHSGQFSGRLNRWRRIILQSTMNRFSSVVLVSTHIQDILLSNGFQFSTKPTIQHAFLQPNVGELAERLRSYQRTILEFVSKAHPLFVMQGADAFHEGVDRYGTDIAIEAMPAIRERFPDARLLVGRPSGGSVKFEQYCEELNKRIVELSLSDAVTFLTGEQELWPLIAKSDVFIRPSNQDGDSISVREALGFGVPVVASDACPRPPECTLFASRDSKSLSEAIVLLLSQQPNSLPSPVTNPINDADD